MRNLLVIMIVFCILAGVVNCSGQKKDKIIQNDLKSVFEQNIKDSTLATGWYFIVENEKGIKRRLEKTDEYYFIDPNPILLKKHFNKIELYETDDLKKQSKNQFALSIKIHRNYETLWADATEKSIRKRLGLIIDNKLVNAPMVNMKIESGISSLNRGVYTKEELENFINQLKK